MQTRAARVIWLLATLLCASVVGVFTWHAESGRWLSFRAYPTAVQHEPYYVVVFSWAPLAALAWFGAGSVLLARVVRYRGYWYFAPQVLVLVLMVVRLLALAAEHGFPKADSLSSMTPLRWAFVVITALTFLLSWAACAACMAAAVRHHSVPIRVR